MAARNFKHFRVTSLFTNRAHHQIQVSSFLRARNFTQAMSEADTRDKRVTVPAKSQLDVMIKDSMRCKLVSGDAEIQGYPLRQNEWYTLPNGGLGIHSWHGCDIEISGNFHQKPKILDFKSNCMIRYVNLHAFLEGKRDSVLTELLKIPKNLLNEKDDKKEETKNEKNKDDDTHFKYFECFKYDQLSSFSDCEIDTIYNCNINAIGPRLMILGGINTGKSTLCKTILNYAYRKSLQSAMMTENEVSNVSGIPLFIDLDPGQNMLGLPGTCVGEWMNHYIKPFNQIYQTENDTSFSYFHGTKSPTQKLLLYKYMIYRLSMTSKKKILSNPSMRNGGIIINTCGYIDKIMYPVLKHIINTFRINAIAILQNSDGKENDLIDYIHKYCKQCDYPIHCSTLPVSNAIIQTQSQNNKGAARRDAVIKQYFHGNYNNDTKMYQFMPYQRTFSFSDFCMYQINVNNNNVGTIINTSNNSNNNNNNNKKETYVVTIDESIYDCDYTSNGENARRMKTFEISEIKFKDKMIGDIVAITYASTPQQLFTANIAGFLCIQDVDFDNKCIKCLCSCIGKFPGLLLHGDIKWKQSI